ncbi:MAG: LacI family DNA-binding transcriptional regulator [Candidatus Choladocola sp.]|nr:LacI family DNA-binding transcriptional regulator [Candidatus Choladocola sp.]
MGRIKSKGKITINDIAKEAGVSTATVSRALSGTGTVKPETLRAIMDIANHMGYSAHLPTAAEHVSPGMISHEKCPVIMIHITDMSNPFYGKIIRGISDSVISHGYDFILSSLEVTPENIDKFISMIRQLGISGIITADITSSSCLEKISDVVPVVQCCEFSENPYASSVGIDDYTAVQTVLDYFLSKGRTRIGFINGPLSYRYAQNRLRAYRTIMKENNITVKPHWIIQLPGLNHDMAFSSVIKLLSSPDAPDCLCSVSDELAAAAIRAAHYCNLKVPNDILVIGFDNTNISQLSTPSITTISQPQFQLGFLASELLFEKIHNPLSEVKHINLNTELIIRESTTN